MTILLNPGPIVLSNRVRQAMIQTDLCHREPEFIELQNTIRHALLNVYQLSSDKWAGIVFTGSGTAAMEAMVSSLVPAQGKVLIIENGVYGERLSKIAQLHDINHVILHHEWNEAIDLARLEGELRYHEELSHVAVVHHETTTGRLNDIDAVARLCGKYGNIPILLDAVSSFGAEEIKFNEWGLVACAATANKCLHGAPGVSFVIISKDAMAQMSATPARTLYLDLIAYLKSQDTNSTLFTQSIPTYYALAAALAELHDTGGWENRRQQYRALMAIARDGLEQLNIRAYLKREESSCVLNAFHLPDGLCYEVLHDRLKTAGFVIYAGQGGFAKSFFRISCMGAITAKDIKRFVEEIGKIVNS